jgi:hypothetical protein
MKPTRSAMQRAESDWNVQAKEGVSGVSPILGGGFDHQFRSSERTNTLLGSFCVARRRNDPDREGTGSSKIALQEGLTVCNAQPVGVFKHHLARTFGAAGGQSLLRYVRGRRLSEAARTMTAGDPDIPAAAFSLGCKSH